MNATTVTPEPRTRAREALRLLLVEDNPGDARLVRTYLEEGLNGSHELSRAGSLAEGLDRARRGEPDLVLLDLGLPDAAGLEAVRRMRELDAAPPIVVLTGLDDKETATYALGEGAQDYLVKGALEPAVLERTIRYSLERHRVSRELERTREAVEAQRALSRSILQSLPDHIAVLDAAGEIIGTNEAWRRFAAEEGGEPRGYEGDNYLEVTRAAAREDGDAARMLEGLEAVLAGESEGFVAEYPCHGPDARRWFRASVTPLREAATEGAVVSHIDITDRKRAVRELEEERARLEEIFRQAPSWMATLRGPEHVFEMVNPSFRQMVGDRDVVGLPVREASRSSRGRTSSSCWTRSTGPGSPSRRRRSRSGWRTATAGGGRSTSPWSTSRGGRTVRSPASSATAWTSPSRSGPGGRSSRPSSAGPRCWRR